jgi:hypothetical protein
MSDLQMYKGASMFTHDFGGIRVAQFWWVPPKLSYTDPTKTELHGSHQNWATWIPPKLSYTDPTKTELHGSHQSRG